MGSSLQEIIIQGLRVKGNHGVTDQERRAPQDFEIDIVAVCTDSKAQRTDRLDDTADYAEICKAAERIVAGTSYSLLEKMAAEIAESILALGHLDRVVVTVKKLAPPMDYDVAYAAARVARERATG